MQENLSENWKCAFCGGTEMYFDRSITYLEDEEEEGMQNRCCDCGRSVDDVPKCANCGSEYNIKDIKYNFCANCGKNIFRKEVSEQENFNKISELLLQEVAARFDNLDVDKDIEFGDSFAELLEKLLIVNIRMWKLEDLASQEPDNQKLGELKKKIDFCFKVKRPKLIKAINCFLDNYISSKGFRPFTEENIKNYG